MNIFVLFKTLNIKFSFRHFDNHTYHATYIENIKKNQIHLWYQLIDKHLQKKIHINNILR